LQHTSGTTKYLNGICYASDTYVVVGQDDVILTAPEFAGASYSNTWTARTLNTTNLLHTVAYGNNTFVAVGDGGKILRSTNKGVSWIAQLLALRKT
jgi:photosystem II stability/assembly factor-like uncharacterized protein